MNQSYIDDSNPIPFSLYRVLNRTSILILISTEPYPSSPNQSRGTFSLTLTYRVYVRRKTNIYRENTQLSYGFPIFFGDGNPQIYSLFAQRRKTLPPPPPRRSHPRRPKQRNFTMLGLTEKEAGILKSRQNAVQDRIYFFWREYNFSWNQQL